MRIFRKERIEKGSAKFRKKFNDLGYTGNNIVIGKGEKGNLLNNNNYISFETTRHFTSIERTRGGKGTSLIIPNLLHYEGSTVIIDPKGENAFLTAERRRELGQKVVVLDPWGELKRRYNIDENIIKYNPLDILNINNNNYEDDISYITDALIISKGGEQQHWDESAKLLISGLIDFTMRKGSKNLADVRSLLCLPQEELSNILKASIASMPHDSYSVRRLSQFLDSTSKENNSILSTARRQSSILDNRLLNKNMSSSTVDFKDFERNNLTLYIILPVDKLVSYGRWLRLIVSVIIRNIYKINKKLTPKPLIFFDEFGTIGPMRIVEQSIALMAGLNICMWLFLQDLNQLKRDYPNSWQTFIGNSEAITIGPTMDLMTAKYVSEVLGNQTINIKSTTKSRKIGDIGFPSSTSESTSVSTRALITHDEIRHLKESQGIVISNKFDAKYKKIYYYKNKYLLSLTRKDPYYN